ncbi:MAG: NUDIX hydrolase [Propioniciclava sp.]
MTRKLIEAAGTVTVRDTDGKRQILVVHRPAYDDWSLPKGHLEPDEYEATAAARETLEETNTTVALRRPIKTIRYPVKSGTKIVHYWLAQPLVSKRRKADREVDKVAWLTPKTALARLTYTDERSVVSDALDLGPTTPFLIVRHAKAMDRKHWTGRDQARPITSRGRKQAKLLIPLLSAFGVRELHSSSSIRCVQTLQPYARRNDRDVRGWSVLSEEIGEDKLPDVTKLVRRLAAEAAASGTPTAVCGHRPLLPTMLEALGIMARPLQTAATVIAHLSPEGEAVAVEFHRPRA